MSALYSNLLTLNVDQQPDLTIKILDDHFAFARNMHVMPLSISEFSAAAGHYPIVFVEGADQLFYAMALTGLEPDNNLFVDAAGRWESDVYVPAFVRRYPFMLGTSDDGQALAVQVDADYAGLAHAEGMAFFENGEATEYLQQVMSFLRAYQNEMAATQQFVNRLHQLGLLVPQQITVSDELGPDKTLGGFWVIDEKRYNDLDDQRVVEMFHNGFLRLIEQHKLSLNRIQTLARRAERRLQH